MTTGRDLPHEARQLLARMTVLSTARSTSIVANHITSSKPGHVILAGTLAPDDDLVGKWAPRFADPDNERFLPALLRLAERDIRQRTRRKPVPIGDRGEREDAWERDTRILEWYEGVPADEAADYESDCGTHVTGANIRAVRRRNDHDPELGRVQVPRSQRRAVARRLRAEGLSVRQIAREMNVAPRTVQRALDDDEDREAA